MGNDTLMLGHCDAALGFEPGLRPEARSQRGNGKPAEVQGKVVKAFQVMDDGHLATVQDGQKVFCGGFHELYPAYPVKGSGLHGAGATRPGGVLAVRLHLFHDGSPSALADGGIACCQIGASDVEIKNGLPVGFVFGMQERERLGFVLRAEGGLLARGGVLAVVNARSFEQDESCFHN
jgi:hypothetical protein